MQIAEKKYGKTSIVTFVMHLFVHLTIWSTIVWMRIMGDNSYGKLLKRHQGGKYKRKTAS